MAPIRMRAADPIEGHLAFCTQWSVSRSETGCFHASFDGLFGGCNLGPPLCGVAAVVQPPDRTSANCWSFFVESEAV